MKESDLVYPNILTEISKYSEAPNDESSCLARWFVVNYLRLTEFEYQDYICDGSNDKGIDAIYVSDAEEQIIFVQSKYSKKPSAELGDVSLKEFVASVDQFSTTGKIRHLLTTKINEELKRLILRVELEKKVSDGYKILAYFVTNRKSNLDSTNYAKTVPHLQIFDPKKLAEHWIDLEKRDAISDASSFPIDDFKPIEYQGSEATAYILPVKASDLLKLKGVEDQSLFSWNVRNNVGQSKVNRSIAETVKARPSHKDFLHFHNGITILAKKIVVKDKVLEFEGYTVVNGCQSLTTLQDNQTFLSPELFLLTRVINVDPDSEIAQRITQYNNNQNPVSDRDLKSNSLNQRRLESEFNTLSKGRVFYETKKGQESVASVRVSNEEVARCLLAFENGEPHSCHQSYRLFSDSYSEIFGGSNVNALRAYLSFVVLQSCIAARDGFKDRNLGSYKLSSFFLTHVVRQVLALTESGKEIVEQTPRELLSKKEQEEKIRSVLVPLVRELIISWEGEIADEFADDNKKFDYKAELKSRVRVKYWADKIIKEYRKDLNRNKAYIPRLS